MEKRDILLYCRKAILPLSVTQRSVCHADRRIYPTQKESGQGLHPLFRFQPSGYHFFIHKNGTLSEGRLLERTPAAQYGHNLRTVAICLHGLKKEKFTQAQYETLRRLCSQINDAYLGQVSFRGHCEVFDKACPVIDYKSVLKLDVYGSLGLDTLPVVSAADDLPRLNVGDEGEAVRKLQALLHINVDGDYGPATLEAVKAFKHQHGLYPSGIVTEQVWQLLS